MLRSMPALLQLQLEGVLESLLHWWPNFALRSRTLTSDCKTWTSLQLNVNATAAQHRDSNSTGPSLLGVVGDFDGGDFITDGARFQCSDRILQFDGHRPHSVCCPTPRGDSARVSFIAFTDTSWSSLDSDAKAQLRTAGFPLPDSHIAHVRLRMNFFLDICSETDAPLAMAMRSVGKMTLTPLACAPARDISDNDVFDFMLRLAWSQAIGLIATSTRLLSDVSTTNRSEQYEQSKLVQRRITTLLGIVYDNGGEISWHCESTSHQTLQETPFFVISDHTNALVISVSGCTYEPTSAQHWLFATSFHDLAPLGSRCLHQGGHRAMGRKRLHDGVCAPAATATLPRALADPFAKFVSPLMDCAKPTDDFIDWPFILIPPVLSEPPAAPRGRTNPLRRNPLQKYVVDGGGVPSTGDWSTPPVGANNLFERLRASLVATLTKHQIAQRLVAHSTLNSTECPFPEQARDELVADVLKFCEAAGSPASSEIGAGQCIRLDMCERLALIAVDPDVTTIPCMKLGVPTGIDRNIPVSGVWKRNMRQAESIDLDICEGNWKSADEDVELTTKLLEKEISHQWVSLVAGERGNELSIEEQWKCARQRWGHRVAHGRISVAKLAGKDTRFCLDVTVCKSNPRAFIPERPFNPTPHDVAASCEQWEADETFIALTADVTAAHKIPMLREEDRGYTLFTWKSILYLTRFATLARNGPTIAFIALEACSSALRTY